MFGKLARTRVAMFFSSSYSLYTISHQPLSPVQKNDADTADPDSLCDEARDKIGDLEQKLALANASNEMFEKEIRRLKSIIEGQSGEIDRLVEAKKKDQAHLEAESSDYRRKWIVLFEEKYMLEEKLARQKKELATLNKKVELAVLNKKALSAATSNKDGNGSGLDLLMAKIERQKKELARLNKQVEKKNNSACLAGPF